MPLDQAEPAIIAYNNIKNRDFIAIERIKKDDLKSMYIILDFKSDHLINIKDIFLENNNEIIIIYE